MFQGSHIEKVNLIPCKIKDGFFVTDCGRMSVNRDGLGFLYSKYKVFGYETAIKTDYIQISSRPLHVVIAETLLEIPEGFNREDLIVNHRDGDKMNNRLSNLEWATHSWNSKHAYLNGLRDDNVRLKSKNASTGEIEIFNSIWDCARYFEVNGGRVHGYINRKIREAAFLGTHLLVRESEEFPTDEESKKWTVSDNRVSVLAFNKLDKKAIIFQTATHAAKHFGIKQQTLSQAMVRAKARGKYYTEVNNVVVVPIQYGKDYLNFVVEDQRSLKIVKNVIPPKRTKPRVKLLNLDTKEETVFDDIYKVSEHFGYSYGYLRAGLIEEKGGEMFYKQFKITFVTP